MAAKRRVLLVDDNEDLASTFAWLLRHQGHEVLVAGDGLQALESARDFLPDVALLDVGLPGIDGYEVARRLRQEFGPSVLVIMVTAYAQDNDHRDAYESCFDRHFAKPLDFETLSSLLT